MCARTGPAPQPRDHAIVVGINDYESESFGNLEGPRQDAIEFSEWLCSDTGGGLPCDQVETILSETDPHTPTAERVRQGFVKLLRGADLENAPVGRRLYIFFAGHGAGNPNEMDEAGLLPGAFSVSDPLYVIGKRYLNHLQKIAAFEEIFLFMDCCRDVLPTAPHSHDLITQHQGQAIPVKLFIGYASKHGSKAREIPFPDGKKRGVFSHALLQALKSEQVWSDGTMSAQQLAIHVEERVKQLRPQGSTQEARFPLNARGITVLERQDGKTGKTTVRVTLPSPEQQLLVYFGGDVVTPLQLAMQRPTPTERLFELPSGRLYLFEAIQDGGESLAKRKRIVGEEASFAIP